MLAQIAANGRPLPAENDSAKATNGTARGGRRVLDNRGVLLPEEYRQELRRLRITAGRAMSIASSSHGPVVRGTGSGGAVEHIGHYVTFAAENGQPLEWLHPQDAIAPNQTHAIVVAPAILRIEVFRLQRNYEAAITKHTTKTLDDKPKLVSSMAFRGHGFLGPELWNKEKAFRSAYCRHSPHAGLTNPPSSPVFEFPRTTDIGGTNGAEPCEFDARVLVIGAISEGPPETWYVN